MRYSRLRGEPHPILRRRPPTRPPVAAATPEANRTKHVPAYPTAPVNPAQSSGRRAVVVDDHPQRQHPARSGAHAARRLRPRLRGPRRDPDRRTSPSSAGEPNNIRRSPHPSRRSALLEMRQPLGPLPLRRRGSHHDDLQVGRAVKRRQLAQHRPRRTRGPARSRPRPTGPGTVAAKSLSASQSTYSWALTNLRSA